MYPRPRFGLYDAVPVSMMQSPDEVTECRSQSASPAWLSSVQEAGEQFKQEDERSHASHNCTPESDLTLTSSFPL